ncbi:PREDICTED: 1-acyl-sn-glycerol-3-phosphate acyltransferase epsilon-like [Amphimedon queenslandica]|uniref:Phospholipid/glycerol acyltransferase domain-containing protein n=1 Tax=Amphimedon queenslandica TaxID=400682 RepID=A0A1X7ULE3_AMPQE|nr:PREDICTED: 1-acyl-sn-glycerol-3-phosphate acyltransferase epsilon-like [Amphimedon queenslandica]|eukprot:XP_019853566.1 PREDICTED: 1-acyl-sn-glycerol-3-phosphate acyltransferase epsilon-like [Amphimedon queenslandica]
MILHAPHLILSLRCLVPSVFLMGSSTSYWVAATLLKLISLPFGGQRGRSLYHRMDQRLYSSMMAMFGYFFEHWSGVQYCFYGDPLPQTPESVIYISNHQSTVDWLIPEILCLKQGGFGGRVHYFLKKAVLYIPLYGSYLGTRHNIFLKKNQSKNHDWLKRKLLELGNTGIPVWLVIFPEGTRFNLSKPDKLRKSHSYAESLGQPKLEQVLTPHTTGFELTLETLKERFQAVYDITIIYEGKEGHSVRSPPPDMFGFYSGVCQKVHIHIKRTEVSDIPNTVEEQRQWLFDSFKDKDKLITDFISSGIVRGQTRSLPLPLSYTLPPVMAYGSVLLLMATTKHGRFFWLGALIFYSLCGYIAIQQKLID